MATVNLSLALVGVEGFSAADRQKVNAAVLIMRSIYTAIDIHFSISRFIMSVAQAGSLVTITSEADAQALTERARGPDDGVDMFVVKTMMSPRGEVGWSVVGGPCNKRRKGWTGVVVSLQGSEAEVGNTFAHELGHYFGLSHCPASEAACTNNFILSDSGSNTLINAAQAAIIRRHCSVTA